MKKFIPYLVSLLLGTIVGYGVFYKSGNNLLNLFNKELSVTGFQLGVYNSLDLAHEINKKYPSSIIIQEDDIYRVYISMLTNNRAINQMENYLNNEKIAFYKKNVVISDVGLIDAIKKYEDSMVGVSDKTFFSINNLIMESYGDKI